MVKLALCVIVEGDSKFESLRRCVYSVDKWVDDVHITVNGGEDNEKFDLIDKWCSEEGYNLTFLKWEGDFSKQRNFNFSQVGNDIDYILWADSDDVILGGEHLKDIAEIAKKREFDAVFFTYWYGCRFKNKDPKPENLEEVELTQMRERLIKKGSMVWKKRIHETPVPVIGKKDSYTKIDYSQKLDIKKGKYPVAWLHLGADRYMSKKEIEKRMDRNRKLLEAELEDERKVGQADPRTLLYLMKVYAESDGQKILEECITMGEEYLSKSGWDAERAMCAALMARCMGQLGQDERASTFLHKAIQEYPHDPLLYLQLARVYFNLGNYRSMKHWMNIGLSLDLDEAQNNMNNILEMKILSSELFIKYFLNAEYNVEKAWEAAKKLNELNPTENNQKNEDHLFNLKELNLASSNVHNFIKYLESIDDTERIVRVIDTMPREMRKLPFASTLYNKYAPPKVWKNDEICYFANFNQNHFERWSPKSLEQGIGGSETAVIQLSKEWASLGYKVTVYGDPGIDEGYHDGVMYLPWYKFNPKDKFNIFIQWRSGHMARKISSKKFLVDLHDLWSEEDYRERLSAIDYFMVKSDYHKSIAPSIPVNKFKIISNGI